MISCYCKLIAFAVQLQLMIDASTTLKNALESQNLKSTTIRTQLYRLLVDLSPISASSFMQEAKNKGYDGVTVYRTLNLFKKLNLYDEYGYGKQRMLHVHTNNAEHHHFIRCINCEQVIEFENKAIEDQLAKIAAQQGYESITSHFLELSGLCHNCAKLNSDSIDN